MKFERCFTQANVSIVDQIEWETREASIPGANFYMPAVEVPRSWSQNATNILAQKYLRKAGVPSNVMYMPENEDILPIWLYRSVASFPGNTTFSGETSAKQVFHRMAGCWTYWGWKNKYFDSELSALVFYDELYWMLANQFAAPNSPQWFNTGLWWAYGIEGPDCGNWAIGENGEPFQPGNSYQYPQVHACFLTSTDDDLVNPGGIMDTWVREARIFKQGSGSGINVSQWRGKDESLSGGGRASGAMSFLRIGDSAAGAIQSGGVTRRAAKMVAMDIDHPEMEEFIDWKVREEYKAAAMYVGSQLLRNYYTDIGDARRDPFIAVPEAIIDRMANGFEPEVLGIDWEGEAISSVDGQNSNNSVRTKDEFIDHLKTGEPWLFTNRTDGEVAKEVVASDLWHRLCRAAWASADPGLLFHSTINAWHTCPNDGEIRTTNPCAEFHFLDGSACDLASLNLCKFIYSDTFNCKTFEYAARMWTVVLDLSAGNAGFPAREFAVGTRDYRTLGLGYANLGGLLAKMDLRYDSDDGRALAAGVTALMTGVAYRASAEMADELGSFPRFESNRVKMHHVLFNHAFASRREMRADKYVDLNVLPFSARPLTETNPRDGSLWHSVDKVWNEVLKSTASFRNAQVTLLAPTGTIALVMDCETTGIEPFYSRQSFKNLAGGGMMSFFSNDITDEDCAMPSMLGGPCLSPMAHVKMVAAVQPFLSGGVSKTVNLPHDATVEDVDHIYREAHKLGLKSISVYRDGSKLSQPLSTSAMSNLGLLSSADATLSTAADDAVDLKRGVRRELPSLRPRASRWQLECAGQSVYLSTGDHEDGSLGEIFVSISKEGSTVRSMMECFSKAISIALQYGVPLDVFVHAFAHTQFEPAGMVNGDTRVRFCSSLPDLIMRHLAIEYLNRDDLATVPKSESVQNIALVAAQIAPIMSTHSAPNMLMVSDICWECNGYGTLRRDGSCLTCVECGARTGCG
jgi:ribonucleotide reductase alpha subunit